MKANNNRPLGWTTVEESQQLVDAGLPVETADMHYLNYSDNEFGALTFPYVDTSPSVRSWVIPCWSLGALVQLLPRTIKQEYNLLINTELWVMYRNPFLKDVECLFDNSPFLIENVKDAIIWLLKNNYIK